MKERTENKMGVMPVKKLIVMMSLPMMISMMVQALYNVVDSIFVSQINEEALTAVTLAFPMQNLMISKEKIINDGIFMQRFFEKDNVRMNLVDLDDVACIAADVLTDNRYDYGTYELCGPENLCESEIIYAMENAFGKTVKSQFIPDDAFVEQMKKEGRSETYINTLLIMFRHYQNEGFMGNPTTLQSMLKRKPVTLEEFLKKEIGK